MKLLDPAQIPVQFVRRSRSAVSTVTSGHAAVYDGTEGNLIKSAGAAPVLANDATVLRTTDTFAGNKLTLPRGHLAGLQLSNNVTTPNTSLDVSAGQARDSTDALNIVFSASKTIDCTTTGANGLDAGSLVNSTWYHVFAIAKADGTAAVLASTSASSPTLPSGYAYKRRIGSFKTDGSAHIVAFSQNGDEFLWAVPVADINVSNLGTSAVLYALSTPLGVKVLAIIAGTIVCPATANTFVLFSSPDTTDTAPAVNGLATVGVGAANTYASLQATVRTDTSSQIRARSTNAATDVFVNTFGWLDRRGKDD